MYTLTMPNTKGDPFVYRGYTCSVYYSSADRLWLWSADRDTSTNADLRGCEPSRELALMSLAGDIAHAEYKLKTE